MWLVWALRVTESIFELNEICYKFKTICKCLVNCKPRTNGASLKNNTIDSGLKNVVADLQKCYDLYVSIPLDTAVWLFSKWF